MSITVHVFMTCDICGESTEDWGVGGPHDASKQACRAKAKEEGWVKVKGQDVCQGCAEGLAF